MSTSVLKALPGKLDIKRHSPSILYLPVSYLVDCVCGQLATWASTVGIPINIATDVPVVSLKLAPRHKGGTSMVKVGHT